MVKTQSRTLKTRAKLLTAAESIVTSSSHQALRVEQVVTGAGVAKGTFFAHFKDKDALMEALIGPRMHAHIDDIAAQPTPTDINTLIDALWPLISFITSERYVYDVVLRHSGAAAKEEIGSIAEAFYRMGMVMGPWLAQGPFRKDISPVLLADGVGAFLFQATALHFCALHNEQAMQDRLKVYLTAWLLPQTQA